MAEGGSARRGLRRFGALLALGVASLASTAPTAPGSFAALRDLDRRVAIAVDRLLVANAALCPRTRPDFGIVLHAADQYGGATGPVFAAGAPVAVEIVVPGGAGAAAGVRADDGIVAIAGVAVAPVARADGHPSAETRDRAAAMLAVLPQGPASLRLLREGVARDVVLVPRRACAVQVEVTTGGGRNAAAADGRIAIGGALVARVDDDGLAVVLAHELAHIVLDHHARLAAAGVRHRLGAEFGRSRRLIRATEDDADRLSAWLLFNAGIDVRAAAAFWRTAGRALDGGPFRSRTHSGAATRARLVEGEIPALAAVTVRPAAPEWMERAAGGVDQGRFR